MPLGRWVSKNIRALEISVNRGSPSQLTCLSFSGVVINRNYPKGLRSALFLLNFALRNYQLGKCGVVLGLFLHSSRDIIGLSVATFYLNLVFSRGSPFYDCPSLAKGAIGATERDLHATAGPTAEANGYGPRAALIRRGRRRRVL